MSLKSGFNEVEELVLILRDHPQGLANHRVVPAGQRAAHIGLQPDAVDAQCMESPFGENWLSPRYAHAHVGGWRSAFAHAVVDPLLALTVELPRDVIVALGDRSVDWPADLRRRWTYAAAAGALGTFV